MEIDTAGLHFIESLNQHIGFVREAGLQIGVNLEQLTAHDLSKFTVAEFTGYAQYFHGGGAPELFASAWLHHLQHNEHHWQHWIIPPRAQVRVMPKRFVLEMVADWMGARKACTGLWDMTEWLAKNLDTVVLHNKSTQYLNTVLRSLGYSPKRHGRL